MRRISWISESRQEAPAAWRLPVAGDDAAAKAIVMQLVDELGFDSVDAGGLDDSWRQQPGTPVYTKDLDANSGTRRALAQAGKDGHIFGAARPRVQAHFRRKPPDGNAIRTFPRAAPTVASLRDAQRLGSRVGGALDTRGFEAFGSPSLGLAFSLRRPRRPHAVSRAEAIAHAALLSRVSALPVNGDLEDGFGADPEEPAATVRAAIEAGLAGGGSRTLRPIPLVRFTISTRPWGASRSRAQPLADASC